MQGNSSKLTTLWHVIAIALVATLLFLRFGSSEDSAEAASFPKRPIKIVVPFGAGGGSDTFARILQKSIEDNGLVDQPLVIINRPGGSGTVGSRSVKNVIADGYTILCLHDAMFTAQLSGKVPFGPEAFEPIAQTGRVNTVVAVPKDSPYQDLGDLMEAALEAPDSIRFGSNLGSPAQFGGLLLELEKPGAKFRYVHSGGGQQRYTKLLGGHLDVAVFSVDELVAFSGDGNIRALALFTEERLASMNDIPTAREQGFDVVHGISHYWWAPKDTPEATIDTLAAILEEAIQTEDAREQLARSYIEPLFTSGEALKDAITARSEQLSAVDLPEAENVPDFTKVVMGIVAAFLIWVIVDSVKSKGSSSPKEAPSGQAGLALIFAVLACAYVIIMQNNWIGFAWITAAFIFGAGMFLGFRGGKKTIFLAEIAILAGLGIEFLFTKVFIIDLPGMGA